MQNTTSSLTKNVSLWLFIGLLALSSLLLLPITDNFVLVTKNFVLFFSTIFLLALFVWKSFTTRNTEFVVAPFTLPLVLFGASTLASVFFTNAYPHENLLGFGGIYLSMVLIALLGGSILPKANSRILITALGVIASLVSISSLMQLFGFGPANLLNSLFSIQLPTTLMFNLTGSSFIALQLIIVSLVTMLGYIVINKTFPKLFAVLIPVLILGAGIHVWSLLPGKQSPLLLPQASASWSVALDAIRSPRAALIGVGPAAYSNIYTQFKPVSVNGSDLWNVQFNQASNFPLTLLATNGFLGLISWLLLSLLLVKQLQTASPEGKPVLIGLIILFILHLLIPANVVLLTLEAVLLASFIASEKYRFAHVTFSPLSVKVTKKESDFTTNEKTRSQWPSVIGLVFGATVVVALFYLTGRAYAAHVMMNNASKAVQNDDGVAAYEYQQQAVQLNPYLDNFRREYAVTNMLIAAALSNKTDATETEKNQVAELIQQAIREARSATLLDPNDTQNWLVLAQIYQNMIGVTEEAEQWAIQSYVQAIQTSPTDPTLRVNLGGIFLNAKQYAQAAQLFNQATQLKADYPNGYYNLAIALQNLEQYTDAKLAYERVLALLEPTSEDYTTVTAELEKLQKIIDTTAEASASGNLTEDASTSIINQNIEDQDTVINEPSTGDLNLTETPVPSPSPQATPSPTL